MILDYLETSTRASDAVFSDAQSAFIAGPLVIRETVYGIVKRLRFFIEQIEFYRQAQGFKQSEVRILDVGCGTGVNVTIPLAGAGYSMTGMDPDAPSIERGRQLAGKLRNVEFQCGVFGERELGGRFHVVICSEMLEHVDSPADLIGRLASALPGGGLFLVTVPNGYSYFELESVLWRILSRYPRFLHRGLYKWEDYFWRKFGSAETLRRRREEYRPERLELARSTLAPDLTHRQSFTRSRLMRLIRGSGFRIVAARNSTLFAGNLVGLLVREFDAFLAWNGRIADRIPGAVASGWMIAAEKTANDSTCAAMSVPGRSWCQRRYL